MIKRILILLIMVVIFIYIQQGIYQPISNTNDLNIFNIEKGSSIKKIAQDLKNEEIIRSSNLFLFYSLITNNRNIQAGEYLLSPQMNIPQIIEIIVGGKINEEKITIIEGWDLNDIAIYLEEKGISSKDEFFSITGEPRNKDSLEGYIFPDTYNITSKDTAETIVQKALLNFEKKMTTELKNEIEKQGKTIEEIIIMASIIEKEVKSLEDKKNVSDVLWKRINANMPLQTCATVLYALGEKKSSVSTTDTQIDSPYNTYKYRGLPIGPISNPGMNSILAAIYPTKNNYWYYLSAPDGKTHFSTTLNEHNYKKNLYLR
ncbi:MAG: endolytic transglycosylase MltG [Candidatus Pacebacteria bacterium]|nr:endolytic transglycosylase MltG [Candidatus Paceibacterota bacterium]MDD2757103.1 endolytic transglycosylase MltG [Candidatus Paceibacterota bacterium]MDD3283626.1 endolytic transglycosylase MltG [Candidatus Paceibacterota bacterium]MDD3969751.1 endolytic transglycosylase MltG [Candidatus Paceibacterota bacterium]